MKLSIQSQRYIRRFEKLLWLYPRAHRERYGQPMLQVLRDQLQESERLQDEHVLREVFTSAVLGLPGSLWKEYWSFATRNVQLSRSTSSWRFLNYGVLLLIGLASSILLFGLDSFGWEMLFVALWIAVAIILLISTFVSTRRLFLVGLVILSAIVAEVLSQILASGIQARATGPQGLRVFSVQLIQTDSYFVLSLFLPFLVAYGLVILFHYAPQLFARPNIAQLSQQELQEFKVRTQKRRRRNFQILGGLLGIFVIMNLVGLYDPPTSDADLMLPARDIADDQNMYFQLNTLIGTGGNLPPQTQDAIVALYSSDHWDQAKATASLQTKHGLIEQFTTASTKPYFQEPDLANLHNYTTADQAASVPIMQMMPVREASMYTLLQAEDARRQGDGEQALQDTLAVLKVGDAIQSSQETIIGNLVGSKILTDGLEYAARLTVSGSLSQAQLQRLRAEVLAVHPSKQGIANALKEEYYPNHLFILDIRHQVKEFFYLEPGVVMSALYALPTELPFFFQPNRTLAGVGQVYREQLAVLDQSCSQPMPYVANSDEFPLEIGWKMLRYNGVGQQYISATYYSNELLASRCTRDQKVQDVQNAIASQLQ